MYDKASKLMPSKLDMVFDEPKVFELIQVVGEFAVRSQVEFELVTLASLMSVGGNLNNAQTAFISGQLIEMYPKESIADFKICFQRGAMGRYGDIQRMDGITLTKWMTAYLEEKYEIQERNLMKEKESIYRPLTPDEIKVLKDPKIDAMLEAYKQSIKNMDVKSIRPMSDDEIKKEGNPNIDPEAQKYNEIKAAFIKQQREKYGR